MLSHEQGSALWEPLVAAAILSIAISGALPLITTLQHTQRQWFQQREAQRQATSLVAHINAGRVFQGEVMLPTVVWAKGLACFSGGIPSRLRDIRWSTLDLPLTCGEQSPNTAVLILDPH